ncbi:MAG TPA: hypothetical protein VF985_02745 [Mariniflexile sp.]
MMDENLNWKFYRSIGDGQFLDLGGIDIWNEKWNTDYEKVIVKDPHYEVLHVFTKYWIEGGNRKIEFVAGEFSNSVWGIYLKNNIEN